MPTAPLAACLEPGCPNRAIERGRCTEHRQTTSQRGYGADWQRFSRERRANAVCTRCGTEVDLTVNHPIPMSLGGEQFPADAEVLCRSCHGEVGLKSTSRAVAPASAPPAPRRHPEFFA